MNSQTSELDQIPFDPSPDPSVLSAPDPEIADLRAENDRLRTELRVLGARDVLVSAFIADRARSPELLFHAAVSRLAFDDDGRLTNAAELIGELKDRFPEQFTAQRPQQPTPPPASILPDDGWPGAGVAAVPVINAGAGRGGSRLPLTKEALAAMTPAEITRLDWNDVKQVMES